MFTPKLVPFSLVALIFYVLAPAVSDAQCAHTEYEKLTSSTPVAGDRAGESVSLYNDVAVVGSPRPFTGTPGLVTVYRFDGASWQEEQILTASDGVGENQFGLSVSIAAGITGPLIVVGAPSDQAEQGAVYSYGFDGTSWVEEQKVVASDGVAGDKFGTAVDHELFNLIVGAKGEDTVGDHAGAAYLFDWSLATSTWTEAQKITGSDSATGDDFGASVSVAGSKAVVGAPFADNPSVNSGAAYVFQKIGAWTEQGKLSATAPTGGDQFGHAVSIWQSRVAVGAPRDDTMGSDQGAVYTYTFSVFLTDDEILFGEDPGDQFGSAVSLDAGQLVVGARFRDDPASSAGAAYAYLSDSPSGWTFGRRISASDGASSDFLGFSVANHGFWAIAGAPRDDETVGDAGAAYLFATQPVVLDSPGIESGCWGDAIVLSLDVIAAPPPVTYDWFRDSQSIAVTAEPQLIVDLSSQTTGTYEVWITDGCGSTFVPNPFGLELETGFCPDRCGTEAEAVPGSTRQFGTSVAMDGDYAVVGGPGDLGPSLPGFSDYPGQARVFHRQSGSWVGTQSFSSAFSEVGFGTDVSIHDDVILIGDPEDSTSSTLR